MKQWEATVIEVVPITGNKDTTEAQCFRGVILVRVAVTTGIPNG
jgi:hypothetical protein